MSVCLMCRRLTLRTRSFLRRACSSVSSESVRAKADAEPDSGAAVSVDEDTIKHLERLSLVDFANKRGIARLEEAISFADRLHAVDTSNVEPLVSVLENEVLSLREDKVTEVNDVKLVMSSALVKDEDYYVAPPGNIPLVARDSVELK